MVTRILFDPRTDNPDGTQAALQAVTIEATPTGIREDGSVFILPSTLTFATTTGAAPILLSAPSASTAWRLAVKNAGQLRQTRIVRFPDVPSITWAALTDVDPASLGSTPGHARQWDATFAELVALIGSGGSGYLPLWKANTAYTAGQFVVSPTGQIIQANTTFTSGSTYNATNWTVVTGGGGGGGAVSSVAGRTGAVTLTSTDVGLGNVNNTSDAAKPISTAQAAVNAVKADLVGGLVPTSQIPALALTTGVTVANQAAMLALTATQVQPGDLAIRTDGAGTFILTATDPTQLGNWARLNAPTDVVTSVNSQTGTVVLAKGDVGLGNVDNTADTAKPVSTTQQAALDLKAPLSAPSFTGLVDLVGALSARGGLRLINRTVTASGAITTADIGVVSAATTPITLTLPASSNAFVIVKNLGTQPLTIAAPTTGTMPLIDAVGSITVSTGDQVILSGLSFSAGTWMVVATSAVTTAQQAALNTKATTSRVMPVARIGGPRWAFCGDSITVGSGTTNVVNGYRNVLPIVAGGLVVAPSSINGGVAGDTSGLLLARMDSILAQSPGAAFVMIGTNDASQNVAVATYQANIRAIKAKIDAAGIPLAFGLVPPVGSGAAASTVANINSFNLWLRTWCASQGIPLVDTFAALVDPSNGTLRSAYNSGDGTHPNDAGHAALAVAISPVLIPLIKAPLWPVVSKGAGGLTAEPLNSNSDPGSNGWGSMGGPGGDWYIDPPVAGDGLPAGKWFRVQNVNGTSGTQYTLVGKVIDPNKWSAGEKLVIFIVAQGDKIGSINKVQLVDSGGNAIAVAIEAPPVAAPGPLVFTYTVPATNPPTSLYLAFVLGAVGNATSYIRVGAADVFNVTRMGIDLGI